MVSINRVYQRVLVLSNKEQRGYITPQEFNLLANHAQMDIFEQYFYDLNQFRRLPGNDTGHADMVSMLDEKISLFEDSASVTRFDTDPPNEVFVYNLNAGIPLLYRTTNVRVFRQGKWRDVERVSRKERRQNQLGPLTKPSSTRPTYTIESSASNNVLLRFQNDGDESITIDHIRKPATVNWNFTVVNGAAMFNPSSPNHQDFELHESEETELVLKILTLAGITIKDQGLYQIGAGEDNKSIQQEKK